MPVPAKSSVSFVFPADPAGNFALVGVVAFGNRPGSRNFIALSYDWVSPSRDAARRADRPDRAHRSRKWIRIKTQLLSHLNRAQ